MTTTVTAVFDGEVLRPDAPIALEPNKRYSLVIHSIQDGDDEGSPSAWDVLSELKGTLNAPADWSAEHDHYLYGTDKRGS
jgi:hypothetical protein